MQKKITYKLDLKKHIELYKNCDFNYLENKYKNISLNENHKTNCDINNKANYIIKKQNELKIISALLVKKFALAFKKRTIPQCLFSADARARYVSKKDEYLIESGKLICMLAAQKYDLKTLVNVLSVLEFPLLFTNYFKSQLELIFTDILPTIAFYTQLNLSAQVPHILKQFYMTTLTLNTCQELYKKGLSLVSKSFNQKNKL